jgi:hypothetical protein
VTICSFFAGNTEASAWKSAAYKFHPPKSFHFGRKTGVSGKLFCVFARVFPAFPDFFRRNPLILNHKQRSNPSKKNRA